MPSPGTNTWKNNTDSSRTITASCLCHCTGKVRNIYLPILWYVLYRIRNYIDCLFFFPLDYLVYRELKRSVVSSRLYAVSNYEPRDDYMSYLFLKLSRLSSIDSET